MERELRPREIKPMLAKPGELPDNDSDYGFEMKWDGIRAILYIEQGRVRLASRNLFDITAQYPEVLPLAEEAGAGQLILDGEIVTLGDDGGPSFGRLQNRMGVASEAAVRRLMATTPVTFMIFDVLYRDGASLMDDPYTRRREVLADLRLSGKSWQTPDYVAGNGRAVQAISRRLGLEGVLAKRLDSPYQPGKRSGAWVKIKNQQRQELVIGGWLQGRGARSGKIGALLVGYYRSREAGGLDAEGDERLPAQGCSEHIAEGLHNSDSADKISFLNTAEQESGDAMSEPRLVYAGKVGTGFTDLALDWLRDALQPLRRATSPFQGPAVGGAVFVEPLLVCEVEFTQWTIHGTLRHPSFKGLRTDKNPREVVREVMSNQW
jgi:bifunctional non-homologous end joining protein LigD